MIRRTPTIQPSTGIDFLNIDFNLILRLPPINDTASIRGIVPTPNVAIKPADESMLPAAKDPSNAIYTIPQGSKPFKIPRMNNDNIPFF